MRVGRVSAHGVIAEAALVLGCLRVHLRPVDQGRVCVLVGGGEPVSLQHQLCEETPPAPTDWGAGPPPRPAAAPEQHARVGPRAGRQPGPVLLHRGRGGPVPAPQCCCGGAETPGAPPS